MGNKTVRAETFVQLEQLGKLTKKDNDEIHKDLVKIGEQIWRDELQCLLLLKDSFVRQCATLHAIVDARDDIEESRRVQWHVAIDEWFPTVIANCERLVVHAEQSLHDCLLSPPPIRTAKNRYSQRIPKLLARTGTRVCFKCCGVASDLVFEPGADVWRRHSIAGVARTSLLGNTFQSACSGKSCIIRHRV